MADKIIIATQNAGKIKEFEQMLHPLGKKVYSLLDYPHIPSIVEDGKTFAENATIKAETVSHALQMPVIADDSGLVVDALGGRPGVYSARYAGEDKDDHANNEKVLHELHGLSPEKRTARFVAVIAYARPNKPTEIFTGKCEGIIYDEPVGTNGFGYDPIFYIPELKQTMAQLNMEEKNKRSHRFKALEKLLTYMLQSE